MDKRAKWRNGKSITEHWVPNCHLKPEDLKEEADKFGLRNQYLDKTTKIPKRPVPEFHVSHLKHETTKAGLIGIKNDGGFKDPEDETSKTPLIWWSLAVGPEEINDAEKRLLKVQQSFLWKFATSPAFIETSRMGSFRFTFPLETVLTAYSEQFCNKQKPIMRVYETVLYPQEVMYVVLVHSKYFNEKFKDYPLLEDDPGAICVYRDGRFIWRAQAMCETHWYELNINRDQMEAKPVRGQPEFYVWDHVALAFHMEKKKKKEHPDDNRQCWEVLKFEDNELRQNLKYCEEGYPTIGTFTPLEEARKLVSELWPLEVERAYPLSYQEIKLVVAGSSKNEIRSTGNTILGENTFEDPAQALGDPGAPLVEEGRQHPGSQQTPDPITEIKDKVVKVNNLKVRIINTPPLSDLKNAVWNSETTHQNKIRLLGPERQAFLLVIKLQDLTAKKVKSYVEEFERKFKNDALKRTMIVFTHQGKPEEDIENLLLELQELRFQKVSTRYFVFNNKLDNRDPAMVSDLLNKVKNMIDPKFESKRRIF